jgi:thymidylate synthase (FAD)
MRVINAGYEIISELNGEEILKHIERCARVCYKSEDRITDGSAKKMVAALIRSGHEAMLEHYSFTVKFICDRGVSNELVRHRIASFAQESSRYCCYAKDKFGKELTFINPCFWEPDSDNYARWFHEMDEAEKTYLAMIEDGATPEQARDILPMSIKTEIVMTANLREWRHFFKLRAEGVTGKPHPQMLEITIPFLKELKQKIPVVFDDIMSEDAT